MLHTQYTGLKDKSLKHERNNMATTVRAKSVKKKILQEIYASTSDKKQHPEKFQAVDQSPLRLKKVRSLACLQNEQAVPEPQNFATHMQA